jgi:hypothetical protein
MIEIRQEGLRDSFGRPVLGRAPDRREPQGGAAGALAHHRVLSGWGAVSNRPRVTCDGLRKYSLLLSAERVS